MSTRKLFHDSVIELPAQAAVTAQGLTVHAASNQEERPMTVSFSLSPEAGRNEELEARVEKGEMVSPAELRDRYGVTSAQIDPLLEWLKAHGFRILSKAPDNTSVYATATESQVAAALQVELVRVTSDGVTYTSARNAPSLPQDIAANVRAIGGLQPHRQLHKHLRRLPSGIGSSPIGGGEAIPAAAQRGYSVKQVLKAYGADGLNLTGAGQTIGIIIDTIPAEADMSQFWQLNGIGVQPGRIQVVNVNGVNLPAPSGEETLDAQWTTGIAPGATVRIYATGSLAFAAIDNALDLVLADLDKIPGLRQVSMSLGLGESFMAPGEVKTEHAKFVRLAATGVNVFVSTGDAGSNPDSSGHGAGGPLQVEYESSDPCVVGVGGTSLKLAPNGTVSSETGWAGSGGGKSRYFVRPAWQKASGIGKGKARLLPDVSLTADPNFGAMVVLNGVVDEIGGTSWSAPVWAGFCALINEARAKAGKNPLPFLNPLLYPLGGSPCFRDVTTGSNGAYDAGSGHDLVTGLGVPDVGELIAKLV